jgi:hypothetical protein
MTYLCANIGSHEIQNKIRENIRKQQLNRAQTPQLSLLENFISSDNAYINNVIGSDTFFLVDFVLQRQYIYKQTIKKHGQIHFQSKRTDTITILNDNIQKERIRTNDIVYIGIVAGDKVLKKGELGFH